MMHRNLWSMLFFMIITLGLYSIYWIVVTKNDLNRAGAQIPSAWLFIIPLVNIYFFYKFAEGYSQVILKNESQTIAYFLLLMFVFPISEFVMQHIINKKLSAHQ